MKIKLLSSFSLCFLQVEPREGKSGEKGDSVKTCIFVILWEKVRLSSVAAETQSEQSRKFWNVVVFRDSPPSPLKLSLPNKKLRNFTF